MLPVVARSERAMSMPTCPPAKVPELTCRLSTCRVQASNTMELADAMTKLTDAANAANAAAEAAELGAVSGMVVALEAAKTQGGGHNESQQQPLLGATPEKGPSDDNAAGRLRAFGQRVAQEHPGCMKVLAAMGDALSAGLLYADLSSDVILMKDLFQAGAWAFGAISAFVIVNAYVAMDKSVHAFVTRRSSMGTQMAHLLVGFPGAPFALDILMALKPLGLLTWLPGELDELLAQYKSTRALLEVTLESLPQTIFQLYLFLAYVVWKSDDGTDGEAFQVPLSALVTSLTLSTISLLKAVLVTWLSARALGLSILEYLNLLLSMGKGVPIEQLRTDAIEECRLGGLPMDRLLVKVVATVLSRENKKLTLLDLKGSITEPEAEETTMLATSIARHPALSQVRLDGDKYLDLPVLRTSEIMDLNGRADLGAPATIALVCAMVPVNTGLQTIDMKGIELDAKQRKLLQAAAKMQSVELLVDESADDARILPLLKKAGLDLGSIISATELNWQNKRLTANDVQLIATLILPNYATAATSLKYAARHPFPWL